MGLSFWDPVLQKMLIPSIQKLGQVHRRLMLNWLMLVSDIPKFQEYTIIISYHLASKVLAGLLQPKHVANYQIASQI